MPTDFYGIRHHGPGSARSLRKALEASPPDLLLIEGPTECNDLISPLNADLVPPVSLLIYEKAYPSNAVFYPFAEFSPEWVALQFAASRGIQTQFMDLPAMHRLAENKALRETPPPAPPENPTPTPAEQAPAPPSEPSPETADLPPLIREDPIAAVALADGYDDPEQWWNDRIEERSATETLFPAIHLAISTARQAWEERHGPPKGHEAQREAWMRKVIRSSTDSEGVRRIAVVCGAWHLPALSGPALPPVKADNALLKNLAKIPVECTWIPWSLLRLSRQSGYGAGISFPSWYRHLWHHPEKTAVHWISRAVRLLRDKDLDGSSAQAIEAVRLADTLAVLRSKAAPGLEELQEAIKCVACFGQREPLKLIEREMLFSEQLGQVPAQLVSIPLQKDFAQQSKRLHLKASSEADVLELDLRKPQHLEKSQFLHQLSALGISWGRVVEVDGLGTFKEHFNLVWQPEFTLELIAKAPLGNTVADACHACLSERILSVDSLERAVALFDQSLLCGLEATALKALEAVRERSAVSRDILTMLQSVPQLANVLQYGDVRKTPQKPVEDLIAEMMLRIEAGLPGACGGLDDEKSVELKQAIEQFLRAAQILQKDLGSFLTSIETIAESSHINGILCGLCARILHEQQEQADETRRRMHHALSRSDYGFATRWIEGFLSHYGLILLNDLPLLGMLNLWITECEEAVFQEMLPLLRRTFSTFEPPLRKRIGQKLKQGVSDIPITATTAEASTKRINGSRSQKLAPVLAKIMGTFKPA